MIALQRLEEPRRQADPVPHLLQLLIIAIVIAITIAIEIAINDSY